ncbi:MAG: hypothetical protein LBG52_08270 [Candidatus Peribacteria bacterium]|nr:hypothetical protein [Candidatus Peribacteria bacterium]
MKDKTFSEIYTTRSNNQEYLNNTDALNKQGLTQNNAKIDRINWYLVHTDLSDPQIIEQMKTEGLLETNHNAAYTARPEDVKALSEFSTQINTQLTSLTPEQKTKLNTAIATFYNERSVDHKPKLNLTQEGEKIFIESHQDETTEKFQKIEINVKDRTLPGFSKSGEQITFADTTELVRAAYLTNGLMNVTKNMEAKSDNPFEFRAFSVE